VLVLVCVRALYLLDVVVFIMNLKSWWGGFDSADSCKILVGHLMSSF